MSSEEEPVLTLSYSGMSLFKKCPQAYLLQYHEKLKPEFTAKSLRAMAIGTVAHGALKVLTGWLEKGEPAGKERLEEAVDTAVAEAHQENREGITGEVVREAEMILQHWWDPSRLKGVTRAFETDMSEIVQVPGPGGSLKPVKFHGLPDRVYYRETAQPNPDGISGVFVVVDYKTGQSNYDISSIEKSLQLYLYAWLWVRNWHLDVPHMAERYKMAVRYELISQGAAPESPATPEMLQTAEKMFTATAQQILASDWRANPGRECYWCGMRNQCQYSVAKDGGNGSTKPDIATGG